MSFHSNQILKKYHDRNSLKLQSLLIRVFCLTHRKEEKDTDSHKYIPPLIDKKLSKSFWSDVKWAVRLL